MKDLFDPDAFFDGDISVDAVWTPNGSSPVTIQVIWTNDPFDGTPRWEATEPEIEVHETFASAVSQGDSIVINSVSYEVRSIPPFDAEGFARARLMMEA